MSALKQKKPVKHSRLPYQKSEQWWALALILPCLLGLGLFTYLPTLGSLTLSFADWDLLGTPTFVGFENYQQVLADPLFWKTLTNTGAFVVASALLEVTLGLGLAILLNQGLRAVGLWRTLYFLPFVTPLISVAIVWGWLYDPHHGLINSLLSSSGLWEMCCNGQPIAWLYDERTALGAIVLLRVWKNVGYNLVIFLAGLQAIPHTVHESAQLDGASRWQTFWQVTLPMLTPTVFFVVIITLINAFQAFDTIYLLTEGGPNHSTDVLVYWMFKNAFEFYKVGPASAIAYLLFLIILTLTWLQWQLRKRWVLYE